MSFPSHTLTDWLQALQQWMGFAGRSTVQSFQASLVHTGRSATQVGLAAGAGLVAMLLLMVMLTTALAALLMQGGLVAIWAVCAAAAIVASVAGVTGWHFWKKAQRSVVSATAAPQIALAALSSPPSPRAFFQTSDFAFPHAFSVKPPTQTTTMNANQIKNDAKNLGQEISSTLESFFANNLGNTVNQLLHSAWKWAKQHPLPAGLIGAGVGGAALVVSLRAGDASASVKVDDDGEVKFNDHGLVNRVTGAAQQLNAQARRSAAAVMENIQDAGSATATMVRDATATAVKSAQHVTNCVREKAADWAGQATDRACEAASDLREASEDAWKKGTHYVQKNPTTAVIGVLAVGLLAGLLLSGSKKSA